MKIGKTENDVYTFGNYLSEPIETKQLEAGVKFTPEWLDGFVNVAWFRLEQKNALAQGVLEGKLVQVPVSEKESTGVEVQIQAALTKSLILNASYTYQEVTKPWYTDAYGHWHDEAELSPKHLAS